MEHYTHYTVDEAFDIFKKYGVVSNIQVVRRWIREGEINAEMEKRQTGYEIPFTEVMKVLEEKSVLYWKEKALKLEERFNDIESNVTQNVSRETLSNVTDNNKDFFEMMNRDDLRKLCKVQGIKGYSNMTKNEMIEKLTLL